MLCEPFLPEKGTFSASLMIQREKALEAAEADAVPADVRQVGCSEREGTLQPCNCRGEICGCHPAHSTGLQKDKHSLFAAASPPPKKITPFSARTEDAAVG